RASLLRHRPPTARRAASGGREFRSSVPTDCRTCCCPSPLPVSGKGASKRFCARGRIALSGGYLRPPGPVGVSKFHYLFRERPEPSEPRSHCQPRPKWPVTAGLTPFSGGLDQDIDVDDELASLGLYRVGDIFLDEQILGLELLVVEVIGDGLVSIVEIVIRA